MTLGMLTWDLHLPGCASLKEKRMVIRSVKERLRARFNVAVAETDHQDSWQRAELVVATVASDRQRAAQVLSRVDRTVAGDPRVRILDSSTVFY